MPDPAIPRTASDSSEPDYDEGTRDRWWYESSYDLRCGLEVDHDAARSIPGDEFEQLFRR